MTTPASGGLAGTVRWAVVPYAPAPLFRLYAGLGAAPIVVESADTIVDAARRSGDAELSYVVPAKTRPVLLLGESPIEHHREVAALRLLRMATLAHDEQAQVRAQEDELLYHLDPQRFELPEESAVMITGLVRVHVDALGTGPQLGRLEAGELRDIGERIIRFYDFDPSALVERRIRELAARLRTRDPEP